MVLATTSEDVKGRGWRIRTLKGRRTGPSGALQEHQSQLWVYTPSKVTREGVLLGLPGWKFAARTWEDKARISDHAEALGIRVALAEMHTTVYESAFYPQSRADRKWCGSDCDFPGGPWVGEVVVPYLMDAMGPVRGLFGLSTGGRGAVLVPQHYPGLGISRACAMSGTFDLFKLPQETGEYKIHAQVYGARDANPDRWRADDTMALLERLAKVNVLLIHGTKDSYVPVSQSRSLASAMTGRGGAVTFQPVDGGKHDWALWSSHLRQCLVFLVEAEE